jgi:hypothetical protein
LDFIDRISNPVVDNLPVITVDGELIDSGTNLTQISGWVEDVANDLSTEATDRTNADTALQNTKENNKYVGVDEADATAYSIANPDIISFYPEV